MPFRAPLLRFRRPTLHRHPLLRIIVILLIATAPGAAAAMVFGTGSFAGSPGAVVVTGLGFAPQVVLVRTEAPGRSAEIATSTMGGGSKALGPNEALKLSNIALDADGFTVEIGNSNVSGFLSHWIAFGETDDGFAVGTYLGDGLAPRTIDISDTSSSPDFRPSYVLVASEAARDATLRYEIVGSALSTTFGFAGPVFGGDPITGTSVQGFDVSADDRVNESTVRFHYVAWRTRPGTQVGSYAGDGLDDALVSLGFTPAHVGLSSTTIGSPSRRSMLRFETQAATESSFYTGFSPVTDAIKSFASNGFTLGARDDVNAGDGDYFYIAFGDPPPLVPTLSPPLLGALALALGALGAWRARRRT